jgi:demethylmenaquinone methyltransferase/2-methoxy-6-polyprenyl-1,4-benzoquinol methylase
MNRETRRVKSIFARVAPTYDFLNKVLSLGWDISWRRFAIRKLLEKRGNRFLDIAAGTCDVALELVKIDPMARVVAIDFTFPMLARGKAKIARALETARIQLVLADVLCLPFPEACFDGAIIGFGIRNMVDREKALHEMARVVIPGGSVVILEFSVPNRSGFGPLYHLYLNRVLPCVGGIVSKSRNGYDYLADSILHFPPPQVFRSMMEGAGFDGVNYWPLTFGVVGVYAGRRHG